MNDASIPRARRGRPPPNRPLERESYWAAFLPKLFIALRPGYSTASFGHDLFAGVTVAILALPLSMAIAIGAGLKPEAGLITSVVAGFIISAFGGSRFQIGGPAAAFIVIIAQIVQAHGTAGLLTATFLAGCILVVAGFLKAGTYVKYVPGPVILGFTSGIGWLILISQIKDFLGLSVELPAEFLPRMKALWMALPGWSPSSLGVGLVTLVGIIALRTYVPRWPGLLIAVVVASAASYALGLPVETIGSRFKSFATGLPAPALPDLSIARVTAVLPTAFTLAFLIGVESLLSAVAADAVAGSRHRSNIEVVAQGLANVASPLFGGMPATGVIARTGTNISAGARTPVAGILHALFVLAFMMLLTPLVAYLALPCLAAVLVSVAWRLMEVREVGRFIWLAPADDRLVLVATLLLTVLVDLNTAIAVGVGLACVLFMHRMAEMPGLHQGAPVRWSSDLDDVNPTRAPPKESAIPPGVRLIEFRGPLFFGAASYVGATFQGIEQWPRAIILQLGDVPLIDATGASALGDLFEACRRNGCRVIACELEPQPREVLHRLGLLRANRVILAPDMATALARAKSLAASAAPTENR